MSQTYAEYLTALGATADDLKVLDTPITRKAYEKQQADATARMESYRAEMSQWHEGVEATNQKLLKERDSAMLNAAGAAAQLKAAQEAGLIELAESANPGSTRPGAGESPAFDPAKYVDRDTFFQVAEREGDAIATFADIQQEHRDLFGTPINARELRREALTRKIPVEQLWLEKYGVPAKRAEVAAANKAKYESDLIARGRKEAETELASKYANPMTAPPRISDNPFLPTVMANTEAAAQPWNRSEGQKASARVSKVMEKLYSQGNA